MNATRSSASTLHLQMGQEVIYLLLVTSLIANFVLSTLALRSSKQVGELNAARPYSEVLNENRKLKQEHAQLRSQIKDLQAALDQLKAEYATLVRRNQTLDAAMKRAESERAEAIARQQQADERNKLLEASLHQSSPQRASQDQPPIITLREADGFSFNPGSADISQDFLTKLAQDVIPKLTALSERYGAQVVEVIGHTDGTSIRDTLRVKANLDDSLGQYLDPASTTALVPFDNVGLGISRAVSVARALRTSGLPANLDIQPLSAAYLISPNDRTDPAARRIGDATRRRIEIRIRRINTS
jgi:outer membrane protein OmpA-like peptidoglycan-associated protein